MPLTLANSNYNGEVLEKLTVVMGVGNEVSEKGAAKSHTGVSKKKSLPRLSQTDDPFGDYVAGAPITETVTTTYAERSLDPQPKTLYQKFFPQQWADVWEKWQSVGDFTNLELNAELVTAIIDRFRNGIGRQVSRNFFQGDLSLGAGNPLNWHDGIITRAIADGSVIKPTPQGNITDQSFVDILAAVWSAIPDHMLEDDDFILNFNTTDWKTMQSGNTKLHEAFTGVFGQSMETMYNEKKIRHFQGMPRHHILGAKSTNTEESNLHSGSWVEANDEVFMIDRVSNNSHEWFFRLDATLDANYIVPEEIVLYEPV